MASSEPYYSLLDFLTACENDKLSVYVESKALQDARDDFLLFTKRDLLDFLGAGEYANLEFINSLPWRTAPPAFEGMLVDAYKFVDCLKPGYFAFGFSAASQKWVLKSFHLSDDRISTFGLAFDKARRALEDKHE